uniref:Uncharacterized protein n=1 Tax=Ciona intestinalis TaxID=7719 RepID=H2Y0Y9_CIOIN
MQHVTRFNKTNLRIGFNLCVPVRNIRTHERVKELFLKTMYKPENLK